MKHGRTPLGWATWTWGDATQGSVRELLQSSRKLKPRKQQPPKALLLSEDHDALTWLETRYHARGTLTVTAGDSGRDLGRDGNSG